MNSRRNSSLKVFFLCVFLCLASAVSAQSARDSRILSPCPGTWANMQSLVVQVESGCDVYYSVTEVNPLILGIAYDGPVLLEQTGNCSVAVSIVDPDGTSTTSIISYTVKPEPSPVPVFRNSSAPVTAIHAGDAFPVPADVSWSVSSNTFNGGADSHTGSAPELHRGGVITLAGNLSSSYFAELVLSSDRSRFRYMLNVEGLPEDLSRQAPEPAVSDIEFSQWNWIRFYQGEAVLYSIDDEPMRQTTKPVYLDRTVDHTITWKLVSPVTSATAGNAPEESHTLFLPAKPVLQGLPFKGFSQTGVSVSTGESLYTLSYTDSSGQTCYADSWYADVLSGDSRGFSQTFTVFYRGIKQGTISASFIIDKSAPPKPELVSGIKGVFSRKTVVVQIESDATVYTKIAPVETCRDGFSLAQYYNLLPAIADMQNFEEKLIELSGSGSDPTDLLRCGYSRNYDGTLFLDPSDDGAVLYLVSAIARDSAGNISGLSFYHVVIDDTNFYIASEQAVPASETDASVPAGFMDNPYRSVQEAFAASSSAVPARFFFSGMVSSSDDLLINRNCTLQGDAGSGIRFTRNSVISIMNATVTLNALRIEKKLSDKASPVIQSSLVMAQNARLIMNDCDLLANLGDSGTAILATDSTITMNSSLVSLQAKTYGCAVSCESSDFNLSDTQLFVSAKTCSGITQFRNSCRLQNTDMQLTGALVQAVSLSDAYGDFSDCTFTDTMRSLSSQAVWAGGDSAYSLSGCKATGFKALIAE